MAESPEAVALTLWTELRLREDDARPKNTDEELLLFARCLSTVLRGKLPAGMA